MTIVREEEEYDHRSLYERLKSQKDKAEADKAEQFKFSKLCDELSSEVHIPVVSEQCL